MAQQLMPVQGTGPSLLWSVRRAAEEMDVSQTTVRRMIDTGEIPPEAVVRFPERRLVRLHRERLTRWLAERSGNGGA